MYIAFMVCASLIMGLFVYFIGDVSEINKKFNTENILKNLDSLEDKDKINYLEVCKTSMEFVNSFTTKVYIFFMMFIVSLFSYTIIDEFHKNFIDDCYKNFFFIGKILSIVILIFAVIPFLKLMFEARKITNNR